MKYILFYLVLNYHLVYGENWNWSVSLNYDISAKNNRENNYLLNVTQFDEVSGGRLRLNAGLLTGINLSRYKTLTTVHTDTVTEAINNDNIIDEKAEILYGIGGRLTLMNLIFVQLYGGNLGFVADSNFSDLRLSYGICTEILNLPVDFSLSIVNNSGYGFGLTYNIGSRPGVGSSGSGPSPPVDGADSRPPDCGSAEIDNFKNAAFDLNNKIVELKEKLKGVSDGLAESNDVLAAIGAHSGGAIGWAKDELSKGVSSSTNAVASGDIPNSPLKFLTNKLGTLKSGVVDGAAELKSVPDDLKAIGEQAQSLLASAGELPKAAKSLGFSKAPAALKSIKATTGVLKNIPNEVTAIGDESKKVMEEIDKVLKNIQSILSTT